MFNKANIFISISLLLFILSSYAESDDKYCGSLFKDSDPGTFVKMAAPGFVSTHFHDDAPISFSPDMKEAIFRVVGKQGDSTISVLYHTQLDETGCWSKPKPLPFLKNVMNGMAIFSWDGSGLYFTSKQLLPDEKSVKPKSRIWFVEKDGKNWQEPELLDHPFNNYDLNGGLTISEDGTMIVAIDKPEGKGRHDFYIAKPVNGKYKSISALDGKVNSENMEVVPFLDKNKRYLVFTRLNSENRVVFMVSFPEKNGSWSLPEEITELNPYLPKFAAVTPDGKWFQFVSHKQYDYSNTKSTWSILEMEPTPASNNADIFFTSSKVVFDRLKKFEQSN